MRLEPNQIHVWHADLVISPEKETTQSALLSTDELERAKRFHAPVHRMRFIAARSILRQILGLYLGVAPQEITFSYAEHNKPYLLKPAKTGLQFNLAHSYDMAVYAFTLTQLIGVDIEKIKDYYEPAVAKRFFSRQENTELMSLPPDEQTAGFYRIWARKEAIVKAVGKGLSIPLSSFSVSAKPIAESLTLESDSWSLVPLSINPGYQAALASNQPINEVSMWQLSEDGVERV